MAQRVLQLMSDYGVDDCPLWHQRSETEVGLASAEELGLSRELRADLRDWNDEATADPLGESEQTAWSPERASQHRMRSFDLAVRVQIELGDDVDIWCGGRESFLEHAGLPGHPAVLLAGEQAGAAVDRSERGVTESATVAAMGGRPDTARAIIAWRQLTQRVGMPFGDSRTRARGLRAAGLLQRELSSCTIVFRAGARRESDYDRDDR
ncbi:MAG: hypothetical protein J0I50_06535 [Microbacterium sp.]|uniref:hypothetical protein n=1 Tax=Bacteria TaxID=2 RepID=UPI001ACA95CA|nr:MULTISPECIES: hypothetical protein [Bacteria]MBN9153539.1 hypothetical protein [Microbacterium sp.]MBN9171534.1 hypothetical protein [Microbacterium sp.]